MPAITRKNRDKNFIKSANFANAANLANSNYLDLGTAEPYPITDRILVHLETAAAVGANNKNIFVRLQHSDDTNPANFVNIPEIANPLLTVPNSGVGYNAANIKTPLPPTIKRYIRAQANGEANGGDPSASQFTISLSF